MLPELSGSEAEITAAVLAELVASGLPEGCTKDIAALVKASFPGREIGQGILVDPAIQGGLVGILDLPAPLHTVVLLRQATLWLLIAPYASAAGLFKIVQAEAGTNKVEINGPKKEESRGFTCCLFSSEALETLVRIAGKSNYRFSVNPGDSWPDLLKVTAIIKSL